VPGILDAKITETKAVGLFINVAKYIVRGDLTATPGTVVRVEYVKYLGSFVGSVGRDNK
jgi:hypothetical protein